jgi:hypothetical protein
MTGPENAITADAAAEAALDAARYRAKTYTPAAHSHVWNATKTS